MYIFAGNISKLRFLIEPVDIGCWLCFYLISLSCSLNRVAWIFLGEKMNNKWLLWVLLTAGLSGCSLTDSDSVSSRNRVSNVLITEPLLADYKSELAIAKLSQLINHSKLSKNNLAQLYYDRGVIYDSLGLRALSQLDFRRALELKPAYADAYNFIGIQLSLTGQYAQAFEAFDSALEINPEHSYVYLNRGIAFYYYGRAELSKTDLETFYRENSTDPYRAIWLYLSEFEIDPKLAKERLLSHATLLNKFDWPYQIVSLFLQ